MAATRLLSKDSFLEHRDKGNRIVSITAAATV